MGWEPGGAPPPPPPVPPDQPPPTVIETPDPRRSSDGRPALVGGLAVALAISLAVNAIIALRVKDETDRQAALRAKVATLQSEVEALQKQSPQGGTTLLARIAAAVEEIRHLTFTKVVKPELLSDEQLRARVESQFKEDSPQADVEQDDEVLTALGLLGPRDDLFDILLGVQTEQVAGFYDTRKKVLVVGGDVKRPSPLDQVLLAHEYVHALTDQHFDLTRFDKLTETGKDDEATAYLALIEGDATVMMFKYAQDYLTATQQQDVQNEAAGAPADKLLAAPNVIRQSLLFPYEKGREFAEAILSSGGTTALDKAYRDPPTSTEQILHPTKYLSNRRDDPTAVTMPNLARAMGSGWTAVEGGGIGEFDLQLLIDQFLSSGDARDAAAGWDGGRYAAAESSKGTAVAIETVWDSVSEAREAASVLERWLPARYANRGTDVRLAGATGRGWESPDGAGSVTRDGNRILIVVAPDRASVDRARAAFPGF